MFPILSLRNLMRVGNLTAIYQHQVSQRELGKPTVYASYVIVNAFISV